jgi:hypothetical protein
MQPAGWSIAPKVLSTKVSDPHHVLVISRIGVSRIAEFPGSTRDYSAACPAHSSASVVNPVVSASAGQITVIG